MNVTALAWLCQLVAYKIAPAPMQSWRPCLAALVCAVREEWMHWSFSVLGVVAHKQWFVVSIALLTLL